MENLNTELATRPDAEKPKPNAQGRGTFSSKELNPELIAKYTVNDFT